VRTDKPRVYHPRAALENRRITSPDAANAPALATSNPWAIGARGTSDRTTILRVDDPKITARLARASVERAAANVSVGRLFLQLRNTVDPGI
jgi:hypothetical protein